MTAKSCLFYYNSTVEVCLGDEVRIRRWLRRPERGVVCYIPGLSPRHEEMEYDDVRLWAIRCDNGNCYPILYDPDRFQPPRRIEFVARGTGPLLEPGDPLE